MISIISTDDQQLEHIAAESSTNNKNVFGDYYQVFDKAMPKLKTKEDLFILANSSFRDEKGYSVIGDREEELYLNGVDAWGSLKDIIPNNYVGNIYITVCESPASDPNVFNFMENFSVQLNQRFENVRVFGRNGVTNGLIPLPNERGWEPTWTTSSSSVQAPVTNGRSAMSTSTSNPFTPISKPFMNPQNVQANKYYVFNETGNIMMVTTDWDTSNINGPVVDVFNEVSVFWAAMTKAISNTINPVTNMPYSIYDYEAIQRVMNGCGHFVHVTQEDVQIRTESCGPQWSQEMVSTLLGVPSTTGDLTFAHAMMCSMGRTAWNTTKNNPDRNMKVGNVVFVCEYLMGTPCVSAIVIHADVAENSRSFRMGPCVNRTNVSSTWKMYKDTYMFVTPNFINEYSVDLRSEVSNSEYNGLVGDISNLVTRQVHINEIMTTGVNSLPATRKLMPNTEYVMTGNNFGEREGIIRMGTHEFRIIGWRNNTIKFVTPNEPISSAVRIEMCMPGNNTDPVAWTNETYSVGSIKKPVYNSL